MFSEPNIDNVKLVKCDLVWELMLIMFKSKEDKLMLQHSVANVFVLIYIINILNFLYIGKTKLFQRVKKKQLHIQHSCQLIWQIFFSDYDYLK